jgi:hypothetical protein
MIHHYEVQFQLMEEVPLGHVAHWGQGVAVLDALIDNVFTHIWDILNGEYADRNH